ncbi:sulfatase-like hydrolase/transferase [Flavobacterium sp. NG2]|uniref:sulfatase-like hydrolase/transferase n=1 Tax=Flavobacterium sp. NG2 TaxID=3097547 RepID=UPI002A83F990|nr:sulfatase-like hydrolase/transferase [Flavobacterium sp. NG2]WPR71073.1 sulfatase-like hydrolase/transferase [Flavobacterium sp. NG2]
MKIFCYVLLTAVTITGFAQKNNNQRPNIILLFADDISARELPIYGSTVWSPPSGGDTSDKQYRAQTPVLDKIANEGCYITTAWAGVVCSPSRAMMMTGRYAHLHKWWDNKHIGKFTDENGKLTTYNLYSSSPYTIGTIAKKAGYASIWAGKSQMRSADLEKFDFDEGIFTPGESSSKMETNPFTDFRLEEKMIDGKKQLVNVNNGAIVNSYAQDGWYWRPHVLLLNQPKSKKKYQWWPNTPESIKNYSTNTYGPDVELDFILDFMERKTKENKPFFIYHTSHLGHDAMDFLHPTENNKWPGTPIVKWNGTQYTRTQPNITGEKGVYDTHETVTGPGIHNHVNYLDYQVSLYLKKMKDLKIENNTIFIFCADNGTSGYGKNSPVSQKGCHVPFIVYAPGMKMTKKGKQEVLVNISDVLPTIAELTGVSLPKDYEINGESLVPFLTTNKKTHRDWLYSYSVGMQLIRGNTVLKDGKDKWYDVSKTPADLISFPFITDWSKATAEQRKERDLFKTILPRFDKFSESPNGPLSDKDQAKIDEIDKKQATKQGTKKKNKGGDED